MSNASGSGFPWKTVGFFGGGVIGLLIALAQRPSVLGISMPVAEYLHYDGGEVLMLMIGCAIGGVLIGAMLGAVPQSTPTAAHTEQWEQKAPPPPPPADRLDELNKLKGLLDSGVLTEQEFAEEKSRILAKR